MINIFLTAWITCYCLFVILDNTPCDNIEKAFLFFTSFVVNTVAIVVIWYRELATLLGSN